MLTVQKAIYKARGLKGYSVDILIRGGTYLIDDTISIKEADSRIVDAPLVLSAYEDENVTLLGAKEITNFREVISSDDAYSLLADTAKNSVLVSNLDELGIENLSEPVYYHGLKNWSYANELFVTGTRAKFSRYPKNHTLDFLSDGSSANYNKDPKDENRTVIYSNNSVEEIEFINSLKDEKNLYTYARWKYDWSDSRTKINSLDTNKTIINLKNMPYRGYQKDSTISSYKGLGFYIYNIASALDKGSYYIDYDERVLYYYPKNSSEDVYISNLNTIFHIENSSYITVQNIKFAMSKENAIDISSSSDINISSCIIENIGNRAVNLRDVNSSHVSKCQISHTGGAGVYASGGDRDTFTAGDIVISKNTIYQIGEIVKYYTAAIRVFGDGNRIIENNIYDLPHIAICFNGNNHIMDGNIIHDVVQEAHDAGAIYAGQDWSQRGNKIINNFLYNIRGENNYGAAGVYLDDLYSGTVVQNNLFFNIYRAIIVGGGRDNIIDNNLIINAWVALHTDARGLRWYSTDEDAKTHMGYILNKVPWESELWQITYPKLYTIYDNSPRLPLGNTLSSNRVVETVYPWEYTDDSEQYLNLVDNNHTKKGTYTIKSSIDFNTSSKFRKYLMQFDD